jgi:hypothetical protein
MTATGQQSSLWHPLNDRCEHESSNQSKGISEGIRAPRGTQNIRLLVSSSLFSRPCLVSQIHFKLYYAKRRFLITSKCRHMHEVLNVDEIKNKLHSFIVLCETNILSLINQCWDNYYQIKIKLLQCSTVLHSEFGMPESDI